MEDDDSSGNRKTKCFPFQVRNDDDNYVYYPISTAVEKIKEKETDNVQVFYNEKKEGKTLEYDFAYHNPNPILLDVLDENNNNQRKLRSLISQFDAQSGEGIENFSIKKPDGTAYVHQPFSSEEEQALRTCSWELEEMKRAKIAAAYLKYVESLKGFAAYKLAEALKANERKAEGDKILVEIPQYIRDAFDFLKD